MTQAAVVPTLVRRLLGAALPCLLLAGGAASARDGSPANPASWPRSGPESGWDDGYSGVGAFGETPSFDGAPTGGVVFRDASSGDAAQIASDLGFDVHELFDGVYVADPGDSTQMFDGDLLAGAINGMDPYADAEPDFLVKGPDGLQSNGLVLPSSFGRAQFVRQSALTSIHAKAAHRTDSGADVRVAVLDTGVDASHPYLAGHVLGGYDFVSGATASGDEVGHGTTVAGLVIACAPAAKILPVRVLDASMQGTVARVAAGVHWAVAHGADVVNMSLGGSATSSAVRAEILAGTARGVVFVAAAGNSGTSLAFPASEPDVIAASGVAGPRGDVSAPSINVAGPFPGDRWFRGTGSSFAAALASGGVALAVAAHPGADGATVIADLGGSRGRPGRLDLVKLAR